MNIRNMPIPGTCIRIAGMFFVLALLAGFGPVVNTASAAPIIMSPDPVYDFGELDNEQKVAHTFVIKNAGDEPLEISDVKTSCGCTVAELETKSLAPGQETNVNATFNLHGKQGVQSKKITVMSNDPVQPTYFLEIKGTAVATISVEPTLINFGTIEDDEVHRMAVTVKSTKDGHTFNITKTSPSENAAFTTEVETVTPGKEYKVYAVTNPHMMPGTINGRVTIETDDPQRGSLALSVFGHVVGALQIRPDIVRIQENSAPDARPASQYLQVLPGRTKEFQLLEVVAPVPQMHAEIIQRKPNDYHIKLTDMPVDKSLDGKELVVRTNLPDMPEIRIPFQVRPEIKVDGARVPQRVPVGAVPPPALRPFVPPVTAQPPAPPAPPK